MMSDREICKWDVSMDYPGWQPDGSAPSVSEIVGILHNAREAAINVEDGDMRSDIDSLIARLGGA